MLICEPVRDEPVVIRPSHASGSSVCVLMNWNEVALGSLLFVEQTNESLLVHLRRTRTSVNRVARSVRVSSY